MEKSKKMIGLSIGSLLFLMCFSTLGYAQTKKYLVLLKDKNGTKFSVDKPQEFLSQRSIFRRQKQGISIKQRDLPVSVTYVSGIKQTGAKVWYTSRWLNAVLVECNTTVLNTIKGLSYVQNIELNRSLDDIQLPNLEGKSGKMQAMDEANPNYGNSTDQIKMLGADKMHQAGFRGEGMMIGVLDNGFLNVNKIDLFKPLFDQNRIVATYDFVNNNKDVYDEGSHGTSVLSTMAAFKESQLVGTAFKASYVLLHTENDYSETKVEEANWLVAAEYADSIGVDIINSSLGYYDFDDASTNYTYEDLNGKKALITRAADWAVGVGMVVCLSAGNEGNKAWKYIVTPADADSVLAVGAVDRTLRVASFSSQGPSADGRTKPDVAALGVGTIVVSTSGSVSSGSGTSFASPLLAGLAAGFWQAYPWLTAMEVVQYIRKAGHQATKPDNLLGYGVPTFERAAALVPPLLHINEANKGAILLYPNPFGGTTAPLLSIKPPLTALQFEATLSDLTGKKIWDGHVSVTNNQLPFGDLTSGFYILNLQNPDYQQVIKVFKE